MKSKLDLLCENISEHPMNWDEAIEVYKFHPEFDPKNEFPIDGYVAAFKHIWLELALEDCAQENPDLNISFQTYPNNGDETKDYRFVHDPLERVFAISKIIDFPRKGRIHTGELFQRENYETIIMLDNKSVIFDVKLTRWKSFGRNKGRWKDGEYRGIRGRGVRRFLTPRSRGRKLHPLRQYWQEYDLNYCVVIPKNVFTEHKDSKTMKITEEMGTRIIPFYTGHYEFRKEVMDRVIEHKLGLKK